MKKVLMILLSMEIFSCSNDKVRECLAASFEA